MKKFLLSLIVLLCTSASALHAEGWTNPMVLPGLENRSLGDPYIMKYRGYYYLYVSAGDRNIYCWRSRDLMNWSDAYICCTDETTAVAYAPEVIYWNGKFYMCTSPRGGGHYMLTSDSPTGPFTHQTGNMGRDIDGSMFVDDNGKWYFYHANYEGIRGCEMPTHLSYGGDVDLGCRISGQWTEGPCVFKRNGIYYLIYTGNHVWTNGYRIDYAMSNNGALSGFRPQSEQNPILVDTETPWHKALGHGTAFVGPDLDTYFFCYHNLQDNKARRLLNFERIAWNGDKLMMTGPTDWEQEAPLVATNDYFDRAEIGSDWLLGEGGEWSIVDADHLSQTLTTGTHTAIFAPASYDTFTSEYTLRAADGATGSFGIIFARQDDANYLEALINVEAKTIVYNRHVDGSVVVTKTETLPEDFDPKAWHSMRVEKGEKRVRIYIDGMRKFQVSVSGVGGTTGYVTHDCAADFGYTAVSPYVDGSASLAVSTPVPGFIPANITVGQEGSIKTSMYSMTVGSSNYLKCTGASRLDYNVNIRHQGPYNIGVCYRTSTDAHIRILVDGEPVTDAEELHRSGSSTVVQTLKDVVLPAGMHQLSVEVVDGTVQFYEYLIKRSVANPRVMADDFENGFGEDWGYIEGNWNIVDGQVESTGKYGKMLMGGFDDIHLTDYTVECDIIYTSNQMNGGLLIRTTNASTGGADDNPVLGTDFLQGYFFLAGTTSVALGKQNYGWQTLASANTSVDINVPHHMKVEVEGATLRCYLDDMSTPLITYTDPKPFITGRAGLRVHDSSIRFDNFKVTPAACEDTSIQNGVSEQQPSDTVYNLLGVRLPDESHAHSGVYIKNNRKIVK